MNGMHISLQYHLWCSTCDGLDSLLTFDAIRVVIVMVDCHVVEI